MINLEISKAGFATHVVKTQPESYSRINDYNMNRSEFYLCQDN